MTFESFTLIFSAWKNIPEGTKKKGGTPYISQSTPDCWVSNHCSLDCIGFNLDAV